MGHRTTQKRGPKGVFQTYGKSIEFNENVVFYSLSGAPLCSRTTKKGQNWLARVTCHCRLSRPLSIQITFSDLPTWLFWRSDRFMSFVEIAFYRPLSIQIAFLTIFHSNSINLKDLWKLLFIDPCRFHWSNPFDDENRSGSTPVEPNHFPIE